MIDQEYYKSKLGDLERFAETIPNTPLLAKGKLHALIMLNMQYELIMLDRNLQRHPYELTAELITRAREYMESWAGLAFIEDPDNRSLSDHSTQDMERSHHDLFQDLWVNFSEKDYEERIERYIHRMHVNGLDGGFFKNRECIDFGCGHGNFAVALSRLGARRVLGIDFGENSIKYASRAKERLGIENVAFAQSSVYEVQAPDSSFDFAIQNGVFHHLEDEEKAIREVHRLLKPGGYFWYYTDGAGGISHNLWDASRRILSEVPHTFIIAHLKELNISVNKRYHLGDGLNAIYRHTTYEEITGRLGRNGFGNFRRMVGGFPTDFDHDVIEKDRFGREKFGSGDIRVLAQRI